MKKLVALCLSLTLVLFALAGCGGSASSAAPEDTPPSPAPASEATPASEADAGSTEPAAPAGDLKFGLTMSTTANPVFITWINAMQEKCDELGIELVVTDEQSDVSKQISSIENFMAMGCQAIIINVFDEEGIKDIVKQATDQGIFVMVHDGKIESASCLVNVDNHTFGYNIGQAAAEWIKANPELKDAERVEVGLLQMTTIPVLKERGEGVVDALAELAPNAVVVAEQDANTVEVGVTMGENFIQAHPDMKVVCGINDAGVMGAYEAFTAAQYTGEDIGMFGGDGEAYDLIAMPSVYRGTVALSIVDTAYDVIQTCYDGVNGEDTPEEIFFGMFTVTADNVADYQ